MLTAKTTTTTPPPTSEREKIPPETREIVHQLQIVSSSIQLLHGLLSWWLKVNAGKLQNYLYELQFPLTRLYTIHIHLTKAHFLFSVSCSL